MTITVRITPERFLCFPKPMIVLLGIVPGRVRRPSLNPDALETRLARNNLALRPLPRLVILRN